MADTDGGAYLDFLQVQQNYYDYEVPATMVGGRDIAFRCRRLTLDEWLVCLDMSPGQGMFEVSNTRSGMEVFRLTLESILETTTDTDSGEEKVTITPAKPMIKDDEGKVRSGEFDLDRLGVNLRHYLSKVAAKQLWSEEENAGEG